MSLAHSEGAKREVAHVAVTEDEPSVIVASCSEDVNDQAVVNNVFTVSVAGKGPPRPKPGARQGERKVIGDC